MTNPGPSRPGSNGNEGVPHIPQNSKTGTLPTDAVYCHTWDACCEVLTSMTNPGPSTPHSTKLQNWNLTIRCSLLSYLGRML